MKVFRADLLEKYDAEKDRTRYRLTITFDNNWTANLAFDSECSAELMSVELGKFAAMIADK